MPAKRNPYAVSNTKNVPMNTIAFHLLGGPALLAGQSLSQAHSLAAAQTSSESAGATAMAAALLRAISVIICSSFTLAAVLLAYHYRSWR